MTSKYLCGDTQNRGLCSNWWQTKPTNLLISQNINLLFFIRYLQTITNSRPNHIEMLNFRLGVIKVSKGSVWKQNANFPVKIQRFFKKVWKCLFFCSCIWIYLLALSCGRFSGKHIQNPYRKYMRGVAVPFLSAWYVPTLACRTYSSTCHLPTF